MFTNLRTINVTIPDPQSFHHCFLDGAFLGAPGTKAQAGHIGMRVAGGQGQGHDSTVGGRAWWVDGA